MLKDPADAQLPAKRIVPVTDNFNVHRPSTLHDTFGTLSMRTRRLTRVIDLK
ncbi:MAG: hypothetical protein OXE85_00330 [Roseovarius sp.]|nr:hypothetical protein [Roseovarius sp.]